MKTHKKIPARLAGIGNRIKRSYRKHFIGKLAATILGVIALSGVILYLPVLMVKANDLPELPYRGLSAAGTELPKDAGEVLVAESESKRLFFDTASMNLKIEDKKTKKVWNALVPGSTEAFDQSLISVSYLGDDNNLYEWDSYTYCTELRSYLIYQIENGVQVKMNINEGESERFNEYYPQKLSPDRFENFFLAGINNLVETGALDQAAADKYQTTLNLIYRRSVTEDCYAVTYTGTPPRSAVRQLIKLAELLGYTREMLTADSEAMGLSVSFVEPAAFDITLEATLDGDDFVVRIPTQEMVSGNNYYKIQNIKVLPNFGTAAVNDYEDGLIFVPDGAGALFKFNTADPAVPDYKRPVYDNDYLTDYYYMPEFGEELMMPLFGMTYGEGEASTHGFLGIIEQGAETSYINVKLASASEESPSAYNKAYASFDVTQYTNVKVYGPFSDNAATYLADSGPLTIDYSLRYILFPETVTYYDMAAAYRKYLIGQWNIGELIFPEKAKLYLDFIGTITKTKRILGIPYESQYSMTTYQEVKEMIKELGNTEMAVQYSGFFHGGFENKLYQGAETVAANGTKKELSELMQMAGDRNIDLFFDTSLSKIYDKGNGFNAKKHALYDYSNSPASIYRYSPAIGIFNGWFGFWEAYSYYLLSPRYLKGVVDSFLEDSDEFDQLAVSDLAHYNYADYRFNKTISIYEAAQVVDDNLKKLSERKDLSLYNPLMKNLIYGDYAVDISRKSSDYATFYMTIPFRQLVMNGLTQITTENVNMSSDSYAYYVLQSVELGVYPKFTLTYNNDDVLKDSSYNYYYATEYSKQKDIINEVYQACNEAWSKIKTMEITNHTILADNVFRTDYASGVSVITNYNLHPVVVNDMEIAALGFSIIQE